MRSNEIADRLRDVLDNIERIERHVATSNSPDFGADELVLDAVERCLSRISEAAVRLGDEAAQVVPGHQWADIRGLGNILRHVYHRVEVEVIREIVELELPRLKRDVRAAIDRLEPPRD